MNDTYNQVIEGREFNQYYTEEVWLADCNSCSQEPHQTNGITHECYVCSEFAPHITTYPLSGIVVAIFLVASFFLIKSFISK